MFCLDHLVALAFCLAKGYLVLEEHYLKNKLTRLDIKQKEKELEGKSNSLNRHDDGGV